MRDLIQRVTTTSDGGLRAMVGLCTATLVVAALYFARPVFAPLAFALFIIAIVWTFQSRLQARLPRLLALAMSILATVLVIIAFASMITWGFSRVGRYIISDAGRFQLRYGQTAAWLEGHGIVVAGALSGWRWGSGPGRLG
jgi:AI-2 transport protein TqsA